jgi:restriction system protein
MRVVEIFTESSKAQRGSQGPIDANPAAERCLRELGPTGLDLFLEFYELIEVKLHQTPFSKIRRVEWSKPAELADLFRSESLETQYGAFIDQRYIDYLHKNFESIDNINWRKFEALTCEFFERSGYHVEIAEGRNDGGIDARIWREEPSAGEPPAILVQCKRQKEKVGKTVVKALWADVVDEGSKSGLIVTTSAIAPGAAEVCKARAYPIEEANRETLRQWIGKMRTPFSGVFMGG